MSWPSGSDPFYLANSSDQNTRRTYYGVNAIPAGFGNGSNAGSSANSWRSSALANMVQETPVSISLNGGMNGYELQLEVSVNADSDLSGQGLRLFVMTTMDSALYNAPNGVYDHRSMFIDFMTSSSGTIITLDGINDYTTSYTWTMPSNWPNGNTGVIWDLSMLNVVAFVQNYSTKEVLQAEGGRANNMENDSDSDGVFNWDDNCPEVYNPGQEDVDGDGMGDVCDPCDNVNIFIPGNLNGDLADGTPIIDLLDVLIILDAILNQDYSGCSGEAANYNGDNYINIQDMMGIINYIMNGGRANQSLSIIDNQGVKVQYEDKTGTTQVVFSEMQDIISGIQFTIPGVVISDISTESISIPEGWILRSKTIDDNTTFLLVDLSGKNARSYIRLELPFKLTTTMDDLIISNVQGQALKPVISQKEAETGCNTNAVLPIQFSSPYPNPFNPDISIPFALSDDVEIRVSVYDITGREIVILQDGLMEAGQNQLSWNANEFPSGVYFIQLRTAGTIQTHKTILMK